MLHVDVCSNLGPWGRPLLGQRWTISRQPDDAERLFWGRLAGWRVLVVIRGAEILFSHRPVMLLHQSRADPAIPGSLARGDDRSGRTADMEAPLASHHRQFVQTD